MTDGESGTGRFVVQRHQARTLHYDFRLEIAGVFKSWVIPKEPPVRSGERRLAILTEDHPLLFGEFEGTIPVGEYGAGSISIWDRGVFTCDVDPSAQLAAGVIRFALRGSRLCGQFQLVKLRRGKWRSLPDSKDWLLVAYSPAP